MRVKSQNTVEKTLHSFIFSSVCSFWDWSMWSERLSDTRKQKVSLHKCFKLFWLAALKKEKSVFICQLLTGVGEIRKNLQVFPRMERKSVTREDESVAQCVDKKHLLNCNRKPQTQRFILYWVLRGNESSIRHFSPPSSDSALQTTWLVMNDHAKKWMHWWHRKALWTFTKTWCMLKITEFKKVDAFILKGVL